MSPHGDRIISSLACSLLVISCMALFASVWTSSPDPDFVRSLPLKVVTNYNRPRTCSVLPALNLWNFEMDLHASRAIMLGNLIIIPSDTSLTQANPAHKEPMTWVSTSYNATRMF